jgi:hypothetical protein
MLFCEKCIKMRVFKEISPEIVNTFAGKHYEHETFLYGCDGN